MDPDEAACHCFCLQWRIAEDMLAAYTKEDFFKFIPFPNKPDPFAMLGVLYIPNQETLQALSKELLQFFTVTPPSWKHI